MCGVGCSEGGPPLTPSESTPYMTRPWMPIYWGDYTKKTQHLSTLEHGAYLLLIAHYWNTGAPIPNDDDTLRRITRTTSKQWNQIAKTIRGFFFLEGAFLTHERVESELQTALGVSTSQSSRSLQGWKTRKNQHADDAHGIPAAKQITFTVTKKKPPTPKGEFGALWDSWQPYEMVKGNNKKAESKYQAALDITTHEVLMEKSKAYCAQCHKLKIKTQHVATWLHQRGWETEYPPPSPDVPDWIRVQR